MMGDMKIMGGLGLVALTLDRAIERDHILNWEHWTQEGEYGWYITIAAELDGGLDYTFHFTDDEVAAFCHGLLAASEPKIHNG